MQLNLFCVSFSMLASMSFCGCTFVCVCADGMDVCMYLCENVNVFLFVPNLCVGIYVCACVCRRVIWCINVSVYESVCFFAYTYVCIYRCESLDM